MKTSRYTNEQIVPALRQAEGGTPVVIRDTPSERTGAVRAQPDAPAAVPQTTVPGAAKPPIKKLI